MTRRAHNRWLLLCVAAGLALVAISCLGFAWSTWHVHSAIMAIESDPARAKRLLSLAGPYARTLPDYHNASGQIALITGDSDKAIREFLRQTAMHRGSAHAWAWLATAYAHQRAVEQARLALDTSLSLGPHEPATIEIVAREGPNFARLLDASQRDHLFTLVSWVGRFRPHRAADAAYRLGMAQLLCHEASGWPRPSWESKSMETKCAKLGLAWVKSEHS